MSKLDADALRGAIAALIGLAAVERDRFGVAVSGGSDSLALLVLAHQALPGRVLAASVDHRLRAEAAAECSRVAAMCAGRGIAHHTLRPDAPPDPPTQAGARILRYGLLAAWMETAGIDWLLTGHHADDQVETLVMRLNRRSGISGLSGIRPRNGRVLRPLLGWTRAELCAVTRSAGLTAIDDPANADPRHDRSRVRATLSTAALFDAAAVADSMSHIAAAEDALMWATQRLTNTHVHRDGDGFCLETGDLHPEFVRRMVNDILYGDANSAPRGSDTARLIAALRRGEVATLAGWRAEPDSAKLGNWHFRRARQRRNHA